MRDKTVGRDKSGALFALENRFGEFCGERDYGVAFFPPSIQYYREVSPPHRDVLLGRCRLMNGPGLGACMHDQGE